MGGRAVPDNGAVSNLNVTYLECVGPIQKLTVPDFQHINSVFEQMQSEILEKPCDGPLAGLSLCRFAIGGC